MTYNPPYEITLADKRAFGQFTPDEANALLRQLLWHRYQLALYVRDIAAKKPSDKDAKLAALDALPQLLEQKGFHDLADHFVMEIATLRNQLGNPYHRPGSEANQLTKIGFHLKNAEDQLGSMFGGVGGKPMSRTLGGVDAKIDQAHKEFVAAIEAEALERYVRAMESLRQRRADMQKQYTQLFSNVHAFLKKLPESDLADVFLHALDENQPLPQAITQRVRTTLDNKAVRDTIVASINGPQTLLEAVPQAMAAVVTGKPMFTVESDPAVIAQRVEAMEQERAQAPRRGGPSMGGSR